MFFEGAFAAVGLGVDYDDFSVRLLESELPLLPQRLSAIPAARVSRMQRAGLRLRDYFVWKDVYNPDAADRRDLLTMGREGHDAFLLLVAALEVRAKQLLPSRAAQRLFNGSGVLTAHTIRVPGKTKQRGRPLPAMR